MRTIVYVDGYNLYHGRLKFTAFKWLDLGALLRQILHVQNPGLDLVKVKFFTSMIKGGLARRGSDSVNAQHAYHRALEAKGVEIILGQFTLDNVNAPRYVSGQAANRDDRVEIWSLVEKQTDVKLALQIYRDVAKGEVDHVVLCTNDSDLGPVLEALRADFPHIGIGVILPRPPELKARRSDTLRQFADWMRDHIRDEELAASQLKDRVGTRKRPVDKPLHWRSP